jgi:Zn-dependent protease with chaperone function
MGVMAMKQRFLTSASVCIGMFSAGCGSIETPAFLKRSEPDSTASQAATSQQTSAQQTELQQAGQPKAAGQGRANSDGDKNGDNRTAGGAKIITGVAPKASVMLEKECPNIVQPYSMTGTTETIVAYTAAQGKIYWEKVMGQAAQSATITPVKGSGISASTRLAAKQLNWLPMAAEVMYGERSHAKETRLLERDSKQGKKFYPVADKILKEVLDSVGQPYDYQFKLFILREGTRNASSRPGGFLYVDKGLLEKPSYHPKAYFAIAHEVAHVLQRHETFELQSMIVDSFSIEDDLKKAIATAGSNPEAVVSSVKIGKDQFIRHHIDQELQADSCATRLLSRVYPDRQQLEKSLNVFISDLPKMLPVAAPPPAASAAERLAATVHEVVQNPINVHPNSTERVENLRKMYSAVSSKEPGAAAKSR